MSTTHHPEAARTSGIASTVVIARIRRLAVPRDLPRFALMVAGTTAFVVGASGLDTTAVFHQYSILKWAILVAAPFFVILLLTVERPSAWAMGLVALAIPIEPYVATIYG